MQGTCSTPFCGSGLAVSLGILSGVVLLGFAHGVELLWQVQQVPVGLLAALSFALLSVGVICRVGPSHAQLRLILGAQSRARLLRTLLPTVLAIIFFDVLFRTHLENYLEGHLFRTQEHILKRSFNKNLPESKRAEMVKMLVESKIPRPQGLCLLADDDVPSLPCPQTGSSSWTPFCLAHTPLSFLLYGSGRQHGSEHPDSDFKSTRFNTVTRPTNGRRSADTDSRRSATRFNTATESPRVR